LKTLPKALLLITLAAAGVRAAELPPGVPLARPEEFQWAESGRSGPPPPFALPGTSTWRVVTETDLTRGDALALRAPSVAAVEAGGVGLVRFRARTLKATDESGTGRVEVKVRGPVGEPALEERVSFGREWQDFSFPFRFKSALAPGQVVISFGFGFMRQTVEVAGVAVTSYGAAVKLSDLPGNAYTYEGREPGAAWRQAARARIERIRKGDLAIRVVDAAGRPVPGASVRLREVNSEFQWGSALQFARLVHDTPENLVYRQKAKELFNAASPENDLKWVTWVGDWGPNYYPEQSIQGLQWLKANGFHARGHVLVWPGRKNLPKSVLALLDTPRQREIPGMIDDHIREMAAATQGLVEEWDTLNEPYTNHDLMDVFGRELMVDWFKTAHAAMPGVRLFYNDFSNHDVTTDADHVANFDATVQFLLGRGAPLGGLGLQSHIGEQPNAPIEVLKVLDRYARFHLPIRVTEFDIRTKDEQLEADYTRDFFTLMFSHPAVIGVQVWGFWEKAHWRPEGAMYRADWSEKPNGAVYRSLVLDQWRTRAEGTTGGDGRLAARGFYGDYRVEVAAGGRTATATFRLQSGQPVPEITVLLP
jgi:endo-1,4-beta-xylanase